MLGELLITQRPVSGHLGHELVVDAQHDLEPGVAGPAHTPEEHVAGDCLRPVLAVVDNERASVVAEHNETVPRASVHKIVDSRRPLSGGSNSMLSGQPLAIL